jgi:putative phage-type endonuclease
MALDKITAAHLIGNFANQSPEWHELRARGIGGSEVGTICGLNPWESAYTLWAKKTGKIDGTIPTSEAMEWGTRLEAVIIDKFADEHPELTLHRNVGTWASNERDWQIANPDAIYERDGQLGLIEVKTARYEDAWANGVPAHYAAQVQWYLQTLGLPHAYVVVLFSGSKYREFELHADEFEQSMNLASVIDFKKFLDSGDAPDFSAPMVSTYETVRQEHPDIDGDGEVELGSLGSIYEQAANEVALAEETLNRVRSEILAAMGTAKRGTVSGEWKFTRQARNGGTPYLVTKKG